MKLKIKPLFMMAGRLANYRGLHGLVGDAGCRESRDGFANPDKELGIQLQDWSDYDFKNVPPLT